MKAKNEQTRVMGRYSVAQRLNNYALTFACRGGSDVEAVKLALEQGADPNWALGMTLPPLHSVVRYCEPGDHRRIAKSLDIIKLLVDAKVQIDGRDCNGCTALYLALDMGVLPFVEALIAAGASVENLDGEGNDIAAVIADGGEKGIGARYGDIYHYVEENYPDRLLEAWVVDGTRQEVG